MRSVIALRFCGISIGSSEALFLTFYATLYAIIGLVLAH